MFHMLKKVKPISKASGHRQEPRLRQSFSPGQERHLKSTCPCSFSCCPSCKHQDPHRFWMLYTIPTSCAVSQSFWLEPSPSLAIHSHWALCWLHHRTYQYCKSISSINSCYYEYLTQDRNLNISQGLDHILTLYTLQREKLNILWRQVKSGHKPLHSHHPDLAPHFCTRGPYYNNFAAHYTNFVNIFGIYNWYHLLWWVEGNDADNLECTGQFRTKDLSGPE